MAVKVLPKNLSPGFKPRKIPTVPVIIDRTNPITKILHSSYILNTFSLQDISGKVPSSAITVTGNNVVIAASSLGKVLEWDKTDNNQVDIFDANEPFEFHNDADGSYTIVHYFKYDGTESGIEYTLSSSVGSVGVNNALSISVSIEDGLFHCLALVREKGGNLIAYLDGAQIGSTPVTSGRANNHLIRYQSDTNNLELVFGANASTQIMIADAPGSADRWQGQIVTSQFWQRALSANEARSITRDPGQIFTPRDPLRAVSPAEGGPSTITAAQAEAGDSQAAAIAPIIQISATTVEAGDTQSATIQAPSIITANQTEAGDSQSATLQVVTSITASQVEAGDTQVASIQAVTSISANQFEAGDTQSASISNVVSIGATQNEAGDTQTAALNNVVSITAAQSEAGDTQAASIVGVLTSTITAAQTEAGDSQVADIENIIIISAAQAEAGDTQSAAIVHQQFANIAANQAEAGDITVAAIATQDVVRNVAITLKSPINDTITLKSPINDIITVTSKLA